MEEYPNIIIADDGTELGILVIFSYSFHYNYQKWLAAVEYYFYMQLIFAVFHNKFAKVLCSV